MPLLLAAVLSALFAEKVRAVEQTEAFLQGLQERGLDDLALEYLNHMRSSQVVDDEFKTSIPYFRGMVLIQQSRRATDTAMRERLLEQARTELEQYARANPEGVKAAEANLELGSVQLAGGQQLLMQMRRLSSDPAFDEQRRKLGREARDVFAAARSLFEQAESVYSAEVEKLPPADAANNDDESNTRQEYRARIAQLRFLAAQTQFEAAQSYPPDADEFKELNEQAASELATVYEEYARTFIVGLYARLYEGRCYQSLGQTQLALGCFDELLKQNNALPPFRKLIASAVHRKAEVLLGQGKVAEAIETCNICLQDAKDDELQQPEWLAVRFRLAEALQKQSEDGEGSLETRKLAAEARDMYRLVAASPGEFQSAARTASAAMARASGNDRNRTAPGTSKVDELPKKFQDAYDLGKDALASYNSAKLALPAAERNNPDAVADLNQQMDTGKEKARRYFRAATTLVDDDTDPKQLNEVRYFLCWLYWESEDYYRAAVLGEFLARRYPDHPAAASAAKIAMASYEKLYSQAAAKGGSKSQTDFEAAQMAKIAEFISRRWPDTPDAAAAQSVLASFAIRNDRIEEAEKMLASASSEARPRLELQLGLALWARYIELALSKSNTNTEARETIKASALRYLQSGFEAARKEGQINEATAAAGLYLAQAMLADEKYGEAVDYLEDEKLGPLTLIANGHEAGARPQFATEAYKAALRAYVLSTPPNEKKALAIMDSLDKLMSAGNGSGDQLTQIYIQISVALDKQATELRDAGRHNDADRINAAFAQFLDRIGERQESANWATRAWLAQTYYNMGAEDSSPQSSVKQPLSESARGYLTKARDAYKKLLDDATKDAKFAPSENSVLAARLQLGECYRELGDYKRALDTFSAVLKERETSLAVQRSAAQTYQDRGLAENAHYLENAIHGGYKLRSTGKNRIWGWLKISQVAARAARTDEKYRDPFFEARLNVARCRYLAAMKTNGDERKRDLAKAKQSIQSVAQVYPNLGGERWRGEFDAMMKEIQLAAGEKPSGLGEFSSGAPAAKGRASG